MNLHLIQRSPFSNSALEDCLKIIDKNDSILFMQDGVYSLNHPSIKAISNTSYALNDDLLARGIESKLNNIDYPSFVDLCESHDKVLSWF